ncbi:MAG: hypothetical protein MHM6MM_000655 [Cercozoa sp. M6MM]
MFGSSRTGKSTPFLSLPGVGSADHLNELLATAAVNVDEIGDPPSDDEKPTQQRSNSKGGRRASNKRTQDRKAFKRKRHTLSQEDYVENDYQRKTTFSRRRIGMLKKVLELVYSTNSTMLILWRDENGNWSEHCCSHNGPLNVDAVLADFFSYAGEVTAFPEHEVREYSNSGRSWTTCGIKVDRQAIPEAAEILRSTGNTEAPELSREDSGTSAEPEKKRRRVAKSAPPATPGQQTLKLPVLPPQRQYGSKSAKSSRASSSCSNSSLSLPSLTTSRTAFTQQLNPLSILELPITLDETVVPGKVDTPIVLQQSQPAFDSLCRDARFHLSRDSMPDAFQMFCGLTPSRNSRSEQDTSRSDKEKQAQGLSLLNVQVPPPPAISAPSEMLSRSLFRFSENAESMPELAGLLSPVVESGDASSCTSDDVFDFVHMNSNSNSESTSIPNFSC